MGVDRALFMDLQLLADGLSFRLTPASIHGILWLQTHFESKHWELLANGLVTVSRMDAEALWQDATGAGLNIEPLPALSPSR